jgi:hypothetical protein
MRQLAGFANCYIEHVAIEGMELLGKATSKVKPRWVAAFEMGRERVSIARVDGNAARQLLIVGAMAQG